MPKLSVLSIGILHQPEAAYHSSRALIGQRAHNCARSRLSESRIGGTSTLLRLRSRTEMTCVTIREIPESGIGR
jgi:hypothetical protein